MPTIIDSLVVLLGLDTRDFDKKAAEQERRQKNAKDTAKKHGDELEASTKKQGQAVNLLSREFLGLFAIMTAGQGIKEFILNTIAGDAAVGRLSKNIGVSTEEIAGWQGVIRGVGGTSEDASRDLALFAGAAQEISLTGQSKLIPYLNLLHISLSDLQNPSEVLLKIADAFHSMDPRQAAALGSQMGLSPGMISVLQQGRAAAKGYLDEQIKLGPVTAENARQAQALQRNIADLTTESGGLGRELLNNAAPALLEALRAMKAVGQDPTLRQALHATGSAFAAMGNLAHFTFDVIGGLLRSVARLLSGDFSGAWQTAKESVKHAADDIVGFLSNTWKAAVQLWDALRGKKTAPPPASASGSAPAHAAAPPAATGAPGAPSGNAAAVTFAQLVSGLQKRGIDAQHAQGIAAGIMAESAGQLAAFNQTGGGMGAYGLGQWRGARLRRLLTTYGAGASGLDAQLDYLVSELHGGDKGGGAVLGAGSADATLNAYIRRFMRPGAAGAAGDIRRGRGALAANGVNLNQTTINVDRVEVHTAATDAVGIAKGILPALRNTVPQANTGAA